MSRYSLSLVPCLFFIADVESLLKCNITLRYTYYEYILNATCETRCLFPLTGSLTFRDQRVTPREINDPEAWSGVASLTTMGSFWGEYLDCRLPGHLLICVTLIAVNTTVTWHCHGRNGIWPPFQGPFLNETDYANENDEDHDDHLVTVDPEGKKDDNSKNADNDDKHLNSGTALRASFANASRKPQISSVTEIISHEDHIARITCIVATLTTICILLYYLLKSGTILRHRDRQPYRSKKKKYTPPYVVIKPI